jgi:hypothetical protein
MDIKSLPDGGSRFRTTYGAGSFAKKLSRATRFGDLRNLGDNKASILKVVKAEERKIRLGKFDRLSRKKALGEIMKIEGHKFTKQDKIATKKILEHLSERSSQAVKTEEDTLIKGEMARDEVVEDRLARTGLKRFSQVPDRFSGSRIRRDVSPLSGSTGLLGQAGSGQPQSASSPGKAPSRGDIARAALNYQRMVKLGGGEAAGQLQKDAFAKLKALGGAETRPGQAGRPNNPLNHLNRF